MVRREGGDPWMGRHLKTFLANAGFVNVEARYGADFFDSPEEVKFLRAFLLEWGLSPEHEARFRGMERSFALWREQVERWSRRRSAVGCFHFGHAVGRKPALSKEGKPDPASESGKTGTPAAYETAAASTAPRQCVWRPASWNGWNRRGTETGKAPRLS